MSRQVQTISRTAFLVDGSDSDFRKFIYDLLIVSSRMEAIRDQIGALLPLSGFQYHVLSVISELQKQGPVSVGSVAQALHAGANYVTMETRKLEAIGFISKKPNPQDGRGVLLEVTAAGKKALTRIAPQQCAINDALFDGFSIRDFKAFRKIVEQMVGNTSNALDLAQTHSGKRSLKAG
jgi:DNA-binding MarR family transcriptional regulator